MIYIGRHGDGDATGSEEDEREIMRFFKDKASPTEIVAAEGVSPSCLMLVPGCW